MKDVYTQETILDRIETLIAREAYDAAGNMFEETEKSYPDLRKNARGKRVYSEIKIALAMRELDSSQKFCTATWNCIQNAIRHLTDVARN